MVFANGCLVLSICRAQATVALSSCGAELYAANSTMVECMYRHRLAQFLTGSQMDVGQRLFLDSSSAKFVVQRSGVGQLKQCGDKTHVLAAIVETKSFHHPQDSYSSESCRPQHKEVWFGTHEVVEYFVWFIPYLLPRGQRRGSSYDSKDSEECSAQIGTSASSCHDRIASSMFSRPVRYNSRGEQGLHGYGPVQGLGASSWTLRTSCTLWSSSATWKAGFPVVVLATIAAMSLVVFISSRWTWPWSKQDGTQSRRCQEALMVSTSSRLDV